MDFHSACYFPNYLLWNTKNVLGGKAGAEGWGAEDNRVPEHWGAPPRPLQTFSLFGKEELNWVINSAPMEAGQHQRTVFRIPAPGTFASLFCNSAQKIGNMCRPLKVSEKSSGKAAVEPWEARASQSPLVPRCFWKAFASRGGTHCENPGLAGPHPHTGVRSDACSHGSLAASGGMTRQGSWPGCPGLLLCSSCSGPGPLCWRGSINV